MTEESQAWGPAGPGGQYQGPAGPGGQYQGPAGGGGQYQGPAGPGGQYRSAPTVVGPPPAGWYLDPWSRGQYRYWDGTTWTGGSFPHGAPAGVSGEGADTIEGRLPPPPRSGTMASPPPPPQWSPPANTTVAGPPPASDPWKSAVDDPASTPSRALSSLGFVALVVAVMLVVGSLGTLGGYLIFRHRTTSPSASGLPPSIAPLAPGPTTTVPTDPSASALPSFGLTQADVASTIVVQPFDGGDQLAETPTGATLDLCNGTYPSESLRTARLQVAAFDTQGNPLISTEAVLYTNSAATEQAFAELKSVTASCPSTPVDSPIGDPPSITQFNPAPDGSWPQAPGVSRLAFDLTQTDELGTMTRSVAVYLRRGRALLGVYFYQPDPQVAVAGQTTMESIVGVFAGRLANLPASVVNG